MSSTLSCCPKQIAANFSRYYYIALVFALFSFIILFLNGFGLIQALQLLVEFYLFIFFQSLPLLILILRVQDFIMGICLWLILHAFSSYASQDFNLNDLDRHLHFNRFFGYRIFESTVFYSATFGIYLVSLLDLVKKRFLLLYSFVIFISILCCVFSMILSQARLAHLDLVVVLIFTPY